jgi:predicted ATP-grasp superfamily ATP-dependent carboligase
LKKVLLTYGWVRSSYAVLRNLSKRGVEVVVADSKKIGMCQWSKYPVAKYCYTSHYEDEVKFIQDIRRICVKEKIDIIFPSHNETEVLARHAEKFTPSQRSLFPNPENSEVFNNKALSYEKADEAGIPVPVRIDYKDINDLRETLSVRTKENVYVVKLLTGNSAKGVFYAEGQSETLSLVEKTIQDYGLSQNRYPQVEEYVEGEGWGCSCFYWHGKAISTFCHRRLREKTRTGGTSTYREHANNDLLYQYTHKLLDAMNWHGFAMVEYKVNPRSGKIWFIEVNPRLWGSLPMAVNAGVEFPYLAYLCATEGSDAAIRYQDGISVSNSFRGKWLLGDLAVGIKEIIRFRFRDVVKMMPERVNAYDDFYLDDLTAFAGQFMCYFLNSLTKLSLNPSAKGMVK